MKELEVRLLIKSIEVEFTSGEFTRFKVKELNRYNKKGFFSVDGTELFVGLFFIYNVKLIKGFPEYTFNTIISINNEGINELHKTFEDFIQHLLEIPTVSSVTHEM